ncbi:MAG: ABC transporter ATP-binding protein [Lactimicrobium sp.]|jgi:ABC-2 type transport system ATP-binding protein|uniref:ABC transporter ATP-binding protein n=1 Tax=Lactimicrobium sp. TaxID=2563780 RepID=UPI002F353F54
MNIVEIKNLHQSYGSQEVLHGVNLQIKPGEIYGLIGPNGAGKTTLMRTLVSILPTRKETIWIDGIDVAVHSIDTRRILAYLPDNPDLYEHLTVREFLDFTADIFGVSKQQREAEIRQQCTDFEITDKLGAQIGTLSHGTKQKAAICAALLHKPKLLVLDEPFVGLDPKAAWILKKKMHELCQQGGAVFLSSHVLDVVENLCDSISFLNHGTIIMQGTTKELLQGGKNLEDVFLGKAG